MSHQDRRAYNPDVISTPDYGGFAMSMSRTIYMAKHHLKVREFAELTTFQPLVKVNLVNKLSEERTLRFQHSLEAVEESESGDASPHSA